MVSKKSFFERKKGSLTLGGVMFKGETLDGCLAANFLVAAAKPGLVSNQEARVSSPHLTSLGAAALK